jgi:hypothetical protein
LELLQVQNLVLFHLLPWITLSLLAQAVVVQARVVIAVVAAVEQVDFAQLSPLLAAVGF